MTTNEYAELLFRIQRVDDRLSEIEGAMERFAQKIDRMSESLEPLVRAQRDRDDAWIHEAY